MKILSNKSYISLLFGVLAMIVIGPAQKTYAQTPEIYAGVAEVDISPPIGYAQYRGTSTGIHDPLYAKAVVFREGDKQAALVVCDLINITQGLSTEVRSLVAEQTNIPYSSIIVADTHTHTGLTYHSNMEEYVVKKRSEKLTQEDEENYEYEAFLIQSIAGVVIEASEASVQVDLKTGSGTAEDISFNRRFIIRDGRVRFNPGVGNPDIIRPAGPVDPEVGIVLLRRASDNQPMAGLINFANHTDTVGGTEYSADYPGYLAKALSQVLGDDFISIFGNGTCGDINHINVNGGGNQKGHEAVTKLTGERLAAVVKAETQFEDERASGPGCSFSVYVCLSSAQYAAEELRWAHTEEEERGPLYEERVFLQNMRARKIRSLEKMRRTGKAIPPTAGTGPWTLPLEVQVVRIGEDTAMVGLPGEVFVELGLAIKEASPFETTLVIELTNRHIAYVPT